MFVLNIVDQKLQLFHERLEHPAFFAAEKSYKSPLHLAPEFKSVNLMEVIAPIYESQILQGTDKQPTKFIQIAEAFEWLFNFSFNGRERRVKSELYDRKRGHFPTLEIIRLELELFIKILRNECKRACSNLPNDDRIYANLKVITAN